MNKMRKARGNIIITWDKDYILKDPKLMKIIGNIEDALIPRASLIAIKRFQ